VRALIQKIIREQIKKLKSKDIISAIESNRNIVDELFSYLFKLPFQGLIINIIRNNWDLVEYYLNPRVLLNELIITHPELKDFLLRKETIEWINKSCIEGYRKLYFLIWK